MAFDSIETPFDKIAKTVGGAATYICHAAANLTEDINLVSVVGEDFPDEDIQKLQVKGVNTDGLQIKKGEKTFYWSGKYHLDMNTRDTLVTELNVLGDFDPVLPISYRNPDLLMLGNLSPRIQKNVIEQLNKRPGLIAMDTMNFWIENENEMLLQAISLVDVLIINDEEARELTRKSSLVKAAREIQAFGPKYVIIKKGEHGALLFHGKDVFVAPALPLEEVFDPTGAGDTFAGGFTGYLAATKDTTYENLKRAVIYGSVMASFCVEEFGTKRLENIAQEELRSRVNDFINLVRFDMQLEVKS